MILFPAIDLYNSNVVRLKKGKFNTVEVFDKDPLKVAQKYEDEGATWLHIVDLNGAETGETTNFDVIKEIVSKTNLKVQVGGGIRSLEKIEEYIATGVARVIIGSFAVKNIDTLDKISEKYKEKVIVSVDSLNGFVTYKGWQEKSSYNYMDFCKKLDELGFTTIVYTDISKDGMMTGPNFEQYETIMEKTNLDVIASGGVSSLEDIKQLNKMNMYGAISGKALYLNTFTVKEVIACLQEE